MKIIDTDLVIDCRKAEDEFKRDGDLEKFNRKLTEISLKENVLNELKKNAIPEPPEDLIDYRTLSKLEKSNLLKNKPDFFRTGEVAEYLDKKSLINLTNKSKKEWLEMMLKYTDNPKVREIYNEYENSCETNDGWED